MTKSLIVSAVFLFSAFSFARTAPPLSQCRKATVQEIEQVNEGNAKKVKFLAKCLAETDNSSWCQQLTRPNESSTERFKCTYGHEQAHQLIDPSEDTWKFAIEGVRVVKDLQTKGLKVCEIYNWWRPEAYNHNVGGAPGRHPFGTSIDVRFCSNADADRAFAELCKMKAAARIRAIGHYGNSAIHIGVGDTLSNTWGKYCDSAKTQVAKNPKSSPKKSI